MLTQDQKEGILLDAEAVIARLRGIQLELLQDLDRCQVATADGCRSLSEWATARLDLHPESAKSLVRTMRRTVERPDLREALGAGEISFDRVEALSRIPDNVGLLERLDVAGVRRVAAMRIRISAEDEYRTGNDQFLVMQPSLDESWWRLWGGLDGATGALVDKTLSEAADDLPLLPDGTRGDGSWRKAIALSELCVTDDPPAAQLTVFVDATQASASNGQTGVVLEAGPRIGRAALEAILCDAVTQITARAEDGTPMRYGRKTRTIPPALRRAILHRDGNTCRADLRQPKPTPNPPPHPLVTRRNNRARQSDHPLLVPSSDHRPSAWLPALPPRQTRENPIPSGQPGTTRLSWRIRFQLQ